MLSLFSFRVQCAVLSHQFGPWEKKKRDMSYGAIVIDQNFFSFLDKIFLRVKCVAYGRRKFVPFVSLRPFFRNNFQESLSIASVGLFFRSTGIIQPPSILATITFCNRRRRSPFFEPLLIYVSTAVLLKQARKRVGTMTVQNAVASWVTLCCCCCCCMACLVACFACLHGRGWTACF